MMLLYINICKTRKKNKCDFRTHSGKHAHALAVCLPMHKAKKQKERVGRGGWCDVIFTQLTHGSPHASASRDTHKRTGTDKHRHTHARPSADTLSLQCEDVSVSGHALHAPGSVLMPSFRALSYACLLLEERDQRYTAPSASFSSSLDDPVPQNKRQADSSHGVTALATLTRSRHCD